MSYLDDFLYMASREEMPRTSKFAKWIFPRLGWSTNDKCDWTPGHEKAFLGFLINSKEYRIKTPPCKVDLIVALIRQTLDSNPNGDMDDLSSLVGKPGVSAWTRAVNATAANNRNHTGSRTTSVARR